MNIAEAKQIPIANILLELGHQPVQAKKDGRELWYYSPFGEEGTPSMHVDTQRNIYKDFSSGLGGDNIHLVAQLTGQGTSEALRWLQQNINPAAARVNLRPKDRQEPSINSLVLLRAHRVANPSLLSYLTKERGISPAVAAAHMQEVHFRNVDKDKKYFGVGMKNDQGGFDIRNPYPNSKVVVGSSGIILVSGNRKDQRLEVFESKYDFLTKASMLNNEYRDTLIINAAGNVQAAVDHIKQQSFKDVLVYPHNDENGRGQQLMSDLQNELKDVVRVHDRSFLYRQAKDMNEHWQKNQKNLFVHQKPTQSYKQAYMAHRQQKQHHPTKQAARAHRPGL